MALLKYSFSVEVDLKNNLYTWSIEYKYSFFGDFFSQCVHHWLLDSATADSDNGEHSGKHNFIGPFTILTSAQVRTTAVKLY